MTAGRFLPLLLVAACGAQTGQAPPMFEAASVKPAEPPGPNRSTPFIFLRGGPGTNSPGQITGSATMKTLLLRGYDLKDYQISGPAWMETEYYEVAAKIPSGSTKEQVALMMQNLLVERFHMAVHKESRELPVYALLVGKSGPKLAEADPVVAAKDEAAAAAGVDVTGPRPRVTMGADGFPQVPAGSNLPGNFVLTLSSGEFTRTKVFARHQNMAQLAATISGYVHRPVLDLTEMKGQYDFTLAFESDPRVEAILSQAGPAGAATDGASPIPTASDHGPTIFSAVQAQLGLKLEQRTGPVEILVVDKVEKIPTEN